MFCENFKIVPILSDQDLNAAATMDGDSINMSKYHKATYIVGLQTLAGASCTLEVYSGATDGACTTALYFNYAFMSAAAGSASCDVLAAWANSNTVTLTHASYDNFTLIIEVDPAVMASTHKWITLRFTDPGGATGNAQVHAILKPRFGSSLSVTALT